MRFRHLDLDLPKSRRHAASVAHRNLVVDHLGQAMARRVGEANAPPDGRKARDWYQRAAANEGPNHRQRGVGWFLRPTRIRQLAALQDRARDSSTRLRCELQRPAFTGSMTERDAP